MGGIKYSKPSTHLFIIKHKNGESLKNYYHFFNQESLIISNLNDGVVMAAFLEGVSSPYFLMTLAKEVPMTMIYLMENLDKHIRAEEFLGGKTCLLSQD